MSVEQVPINECARCAAGAIQESHEEDATLCGPVEVIVLLVPKAGGACGAGSTLPLDATMLAALCGLSAFAASLAGPVGDRD